MKFHFIKFIFLSISILLLLSCATQWTEAIRYGLLSKKEFQETVNIEFQNGLLFVPVLIEGKTYRFLFDSGAPLSISKELQNTYGFKSISEGSIIDSDQNRKKVTWVSVPEITIAHISFNEQTAFIGDFKANPLLACLNIDGIIGSNLQRFCNWTLNPSENTLTLFNKTSVIAKANTESIPFKTDMQFNMFIDLKIGNATVKNVLIDFGSNGAVALNDKIFNSLKKAGVLDDKIFVEHGYKQGGIVGESVAFSSEITYSNAVTLGNFNPQEVQIRTGSTVSVGNQLLSKYQITIDWEQQILHFNELKSGLPKPSFSGFKLGYETGKGIYVQSVIENSNAYLNGLKPSMKILQLDNLNFISTDSFCNYVNHTFNDTISMTLLDMDGKERNLRFTKTLK